MSTTTSADLDQVAKRNAKRYYEQLMAQKKARLLSPPTTTAAAVRIAPAAPTSRRSTAATTASTTACSSKKQKQQQQESSRCESLCSLRSTTTTASEASKSSPKAASKNRTAVASNNTAQTSHNTKAKAWFERTYGSGGTATTTATNMVSPVASSPCSKQPTGHSSSSSSSSSGAKRSTAVTTAVLQASAKKATTRRPSLPNKTTHDSEAKAAAVRKAQAWYERTMASSLSGDDDDDETSVPAAYDWEHEFHRRDQQQKLVTKKGSRRSGCLLGNGCGYTVLWVGLLAVAAALVSGGWLVDKTRSASPSVVWNQPVGKDYTLPQRSITTEAPNPMPCFFSFPDNMEQVERQAMHCRGDNAVRIPCPAHGHCSNGTLQHCQVDNGNDDDKDQYWQVSPSGTACIWTPRVWHHVQFWKQVLTEQSIQSLCMPQSTQSVAAWDPTTGRPLFVPSAFGWYSYHGRMDDAQFWNMVAANGPSGQAPIFIVRQSFAGPSLRPDVTAGSTYLVGLHPSQPLELPPACRVRQGWVRTGATTWNTLVPGFMVALLLLWTVVRDYPWIWIGAFFAMWLRFGSQALLGRSK
jgi:hypothetical protein